VHNLSDSQCTLFVFLETDIGLGHIQRIAIVRSKVGSSRPDNLCTGLCRARSESNLVDIGRTVGCLHSSNFDTAVHSVPFSTLYMWNRSAWMLQSSPVRTTYKWIDPQIVDIYLVYSACTLYFENHFGAIPLDTGSILKDLRLVEIDPDDTLYILLDLRFPENTQLDN